MNNYYMKVEVEAEQFKPSEDQIPKGAMSNGRGDPKNDPKSSYYIRTTRGVVYLNEGDYVVYAPGQPLPYIVPEAHFNNLYTPIGE